MLKVALNLLRNTALTFILPETGGIFIAPRPSADDSTPKPEFATRPFFGVEPVLLDSEVCVYHVPSCMIGFLVRATDHHYHLSNSCFRELSCTEIMSRAICVFVVPFRAWLELFTEITGDTWKLTIQPSQVNSSVYTFDKSGISPFLICLSNAFLMQFWYRHI